MNEFRHHADDDVFAVLDAANDLLGRVDFSRLLTDEVPRATAVVAALAGRTRLAQTALASRVQQLADEGRSAPPEDRMKQGNGMGHEAADRLARHARLLDQFPAFRVPLAQGRISESHLDALAAHVRQLSASDLAVCLSRADALAAQAARGSVEDFRTYLAGLRRAADAANGIGPEKRAVRRNTMTGGADTDLGRFVWSLNLDPVAGGRLNRALDAEMKRLVDEGALEPETLEVPSRLRAVALGNLVSNGFQAERAPASDGAVAEVGILVDERTWNQGVHEHTVCETIEGLPVDIDVAKRLACEAGIYRVVLDARSVAVDQGQLQRLATREHRRTLRGMYRTCGAFDCAVPFHLCQIHHVDLFDGSNTVLANLVPLCSRHHHLVHDHGWRAHLSADRVLTLGRPDGTWDQPQPLRPLSGPAVSGTTEGATGHRPTSSGSAPPGGRPPGGPPTQGDLFAA